MGFSYLQCIHKQAKNLEKSEVVKRICVIYFYMRCNMVILLALFHRYGWIVAMIIAMNFGNPLLIGSVFLLIFSIWSIISYVFKWNHIFCSYQNAYHKKMTPNAVNWNKVKKRDAIGMPIWILVTSIVLFFLYMIS